MKVETSKLYSIQKSLCDEFITDIEFMEKIMENYLQKIHFHHKYSIKNILLANQQYYSRTGKTIELLAPYSAWEKIGRYVRKGEKAIYILVPLIYENDDGTTEVYFKRGPVFDISQTDGEPLKEDYVENFSNLSYEDIVQYFDLPIILSDEYLSGGHTDGKTIWISRNSSDAMKICTLFHELAHYYLHFEDGKRLGREIEELEAEVVSYIISSALGIKNRESAQYIKGWAGDNAPSLIQGRGGHLIQFSQKLLDKMEIV